MQLTIRKTSNKMKWRMFPRPTQLFKKMQWWSMSITHVLHRLHCMLQHYFCTGKQGEWASLIRMENCRRSAITCSGGFVGA